MFYWVANNSKFSREQMEIWLIPPFCCSVKKQCIFVDLLQIKDKFHCQEYELLLIHGVSAYEGA